MLDICSLSASHQQHFGKVGRELWTLRGAANIPLFRGTNRLTASPGTISWQLTKPADCATEGNASDKESDLPFSAKAHWLAATQQERTGKQLCAKVSLKKTDCTYVVQYDWQISEKGQHKCENYSLQCWWEGKKISTVLRCMESRSAGQVAAWWFGRHTRNQYGNKAFLAVRLV